MAVQRHRHISPQCTSSTHSPECDTSIPERDCTKITQGIYRGDYMCMHDSTAPTSRVRARKRIRAKR
jgi:hypothetical protein